MARRGWQRDRLVGALAHPGERFVHVGDEPPDGETREPRRPLPSAARIPDRARATRRALAGRSYNGFKSPACGRGAPKRADARSGSKIRSTPFESRDQLRKSPGPLGSFTAIPESADVWQVDRPSRQDSRSSSLQRPSRQTAGDSRPPNATRLLKPVLLRADSGAQRRRARERSAPTVDERRQRRSVLGAVIGIQLRDRQSASRANRAERPRARRTPRPA